MVEILPEVVAAARQFFRLPDDPGRLGVEIGDGHDYLAGTKRRFDLVVVDGYDGEGRPGMLDSVPFYLNCRARLTRSGAATFNLLDHRRGLAPTLARLRDAFDGQVLVLPRCEAGNTVVVAGPAAGTAMKPAALRARAMELKRDTGLDLGPLVERILEAPV